MPQGSGAQAPADIHAAPGRQHHPKGSALHLRFAADNGPGLHIPNSPSLSFDMKHATKHTFSGMDSSGVEFFSSEHRDHAEVTFRDTNTGDSIAVEGMRTAYLQGAIRNYVRSMGYRDKDKNAREFLETLQGDLVKALKKDEVEWES
tara:strand:+ start:221 stop:661 length:441 start_codon:yes stop_codon:yes gene_type:complete